jgi:hypothetical protein
VNPTVTVPGLVAVILYRAESEVVEKTRDAGENVSLGPEMTYGVMVKGDWGVKVISMNSTTVVWPAERVVGRLVVMVPDTNVTATVPEAAAALSLYKNASMPDTVKSSRALDATKVAVTSKVALVRVGVNWKLDGLMVAKGFDSIEGVRVNEFVGKSCKLTVK